jgi:hypothetical protein
MSAAAWLSVSLGLMISSLFVTPINHIASAAMLAAGEVMAVKTIMIPDPIETVLIVAVIFFLYKSYQYQRFVQTSTVFPNYDQYQDA